MGLERKLDNEYDNLSPEEYFEKRKNLQPSQMVFSPRPRFLAQDLFEASGPDLISYGIPIECEIPPGTRTNVSEIEVIYPWLLGKLGIIDKPLVEQPPWEDKTSVIIGTKLHNADVLFTLLISGLRDRFLKGLLPTMTDGEVGHFAKVLSGIDSKKYQTKEELTSVLSEAWKNYHSDLDAFKPVTKISVQAIPMPGFGLEDPKQSREIYFSREVLQMGNLLAEAWAEQYFSENPLGWEFSPKNLTQREVLTSVTFKPVGLTFIARFDSISRKLFSNKKVQSQITDLKTGHQIPKKGLAYEIMIRQQQVMQIMAERFTAKYLRNFKNLEIDKGIFRMSADHTNNASMERTNQVAYRWFDKKEGNMTLEKCQMDEEARLDFYKWFTWYGLMINRYKSEVRKLLNSKVQYDLSGN